MCSVMGWGITGIGLQSANPAVTARLQWFLKPLIWLLSN